MGSLASRFRFRLAAATMTAALVPVVLIGIVTLEMGEGYMRQATIRSHQSVLDAFASGMDITVDHYVDGLRILAQEPRVQSLTRARMEAYLADFLARQSFYTAVHVYDRKGILVATASRLKQPAHRPAVGTAVGDLPGPVQGTVAASFGKTLASLPAVERVDLPGQGSRAVLFTTAIADFMHPHQAIGVLAAEAVLDAREIREVVSTYPTVADEYVCILDERGRILARKGKSVEGAERFVLPPSFDEEGPVVTVEADNDGRTDLLTLSRSQSLGGWVALGRPARKAFAYLNELRANFLVVILLALVLSGAAAFYVGWAVGQPIIDLTEGLVKVREGVLSHRVDVTTNDELGEAAAALNALAENLQKKRVVGAMWEAMRETATDSHHGDDEDDEGETQ